MLNRDKPLGQRIGDGVVLGTPWYPLFLQRASEYAHTIVKIESCGWRDRIGQPHGRSGDKLVRKAMQGKIGVRHRGPYFAWHASAR